MTRAVRLPQEGSSGGKALAHLRLHFPECADEDLVGMALETMSGVLRKQTQYELMLRDRRTDELFDWEFTWRKG